MNTERRIKRKGIRRIVRRTEEEEVERPAGRYVLKVKCQSRVGWHKPGDTGQFLTQGNGVGNFFPDRGGVIMNLPCASVTMTKRSQEEREQYPVPPSLAALGIRFSPSKRGSGFRRSAKVASHCKTGNAKACKSQHRRKIRRITRK